MKITLVGRPGTLETRGQYVVFAMQARAVPSLPKGVPPPAAPPPGCVVFLSLKRWNRVAQTLQDPEDVLIVEGSPRLDPRFKGIAVHATQATTRNLRAHLRAAAGKARPREGPTGPTMPRRRAEQFRRGPGGNGVDNGLAAARR